MNFDNRSTSIRLVLVMSLIGGLLAAYSSWLGIFNRSIYEEVQAVGTISKLLVVGSTAQDVTSLPLGIVLAILSSLCWVRPSVKRMVALLGISVYFMYAYGLYVIQGQYTDLYLVYLTIFGLSVYSLVFGLAAIDTDSVEQLRLPRWLATTIGAFLLAIVLILTPVWLLRMGPDLAAHVPGDVYGVFVLDLAIVFPAFAVTATYLFRRVPFGNILAGIALVKTFTLCLSVFIGEGLKPVHGFEADLSMIAVFGGLTAISGLLGGLYLHQLAPTPGIPLAASKT